jgi:SAM-dependent methyltransferase
MTDPGYGSPGPNARPAHPSHLSAGVATPSQPRSPVICGRGSRPGRRARGALLGDLRSASPRWPGAEARRGSPSDAGEIAHSVSWHQNDLAVGAGVLGGTHGQRRRSRPPACLGPAWAACAWVRSDPTQETIDARCIARSSISERLSSIGSLAPMHEASFEKMRAVRNTYLVPLADRPIRVLDVGSGAGEGTLSYRDIFRQPDFEYVGLDIEDGPNVNVVPKDPFCWAELGNESFDVVISGQTFEHNPYFWITAAEISRVLAQGGLAAIIAPSSGRVHRFPLDCWRFYPDSWAATCAYVGLEMLESSIEQWSAARPIAGAKQWHDAMMVARKPVFSSDAVAEAFYDRVGAIVATRTGSPMSMAQRPAPATEAYLAAHTLEHPLSTRLRRGFIHHAPRSMRPFVNRMQATLRRESLSRGESALPWPPGRAPGGPS